MRACWGGCDDFVDLAADKYAEFREDVYQPIADQVHKRTLEEAGGMFAPKDVEDCFMRMATGQRRVGRFNSGFTMPSTSVMGTAKHSIMHLLLDKVTQEKRGEEAWWLEGSNSTEGKFTKSELGDSWVHGLNDPKVYWRNDMQGAKIVLSTRIPNVSAQEMWRRVWKGAGMRHVLCLDDAPVVEVANLSSDSRIEYHIVPTRHMLSGIHARGHQYSYMEELVLSSRCTTTLEEPDARDEMMSGVAGSMMAKIQNSDHTPVHLIIQKSCTHPSFPAKDQPQQPVQAPRQTDYAGDPDAALRNFASTTNINHHSPYFNGSANMAFRSGHCDRRDVKLRVWAFYEINGQTHMTYFLHEDTPSLMSNMGRIGYYLSAGFNDGGVVDDLKWHMERLVDVFPREARNANYGGAMQPAHQGGDIFQPDPMSPTSKTGGWGTSNPFAAKQ